MVGLLLVRQELISRADEISRLRVELAAMQGLMETVPAEKSADGDAGKNLSANK